MPEKFVKVAKKGEILPGRIKVVEIGRERIAICNVAGKYYAITDRCTHDGGALNRGELDGAIIECPRHGARFDVTTGAVTAPPAFAPLNTYEIRVQDSDIEVSVEGIAQDPFGFLSD